MLRPVLLLALAAVAAAAGTYPGFTLKPVFSEIGLPSLYKPQYSLGGLYGYLQQADIPKTQFVSRVRKYGPYISRTVLPLTKQYKGVLADLLQLAVVRYYGCEPVINKKVPLSTYFGRYVKKTKIPSPYRYNTKYVRTFLDGFKVYLRRHLQRPQKISIPSLPPKDIFPIFPVRPPKPSYPGYEILATLKSLGLPPLVNPRASLGGIVAYLKVVGVSKTTFISRIQVYRQAIIKVVLKYKKIYTGYRLDLLQVAALRYYGLKKNTKYEVSFGYALRKILKPSIRIKYSVTYVRQFLVRFSRVLVAVPYPGYSLLPVLRGIGLPKLYRPKYTLGGIVAYLKIKKISQVAFIARIKKYRLKIKKLVLKYKKIYTGYRLDLLQVAALRYYGLKKNTKYEVSFGYALRKILKPSIKIKISVTYVRQFLVRFSRVLVAVPYPGYSLLPVLRGIGLPKLYRPKYALGGIVAYLKIKKISQVTFIARIKKYRLKIKKLVLKYKRQYKGYQLDLVQIAALRYYCISKKSKYSVSFGYALKKTIKLSIRQKYSIKYARIFLERFSKVLVTLPYPGYNLIRVFRGIGLPKLYRPKYSVGGLVAYLKVVKIKQVTFISQINKYSTSIRQLVLKHKKQYSGFRVDLLQLAALRYYGIKQDYSVKFIVAFRKALVPSFKISTRSIKAFLVRFSKYLLKPVYISPVYKPRPATYPGYQLKPLLTTVGLPKLTKPQYSLPGLVGYLQSNKYPLPSLVGRIQKYGPKIRSTVYRYRPNYSGVLTDLLQLCAIRYYSLPLVIRSNVGFGSTFQRYIRSQ
ncbi:uncharacterized protein LOC122377256, partial [Amphibalanus amphitrite]|uniref:uncharacterized protein LOC122377256 n=1 Tax=Amphibalanus amphitrite TaxID=1232801 RepID=UPI001C8FC905